MSIIRDVLNENGISVEDLIKVKESFENNVLSHEEFNEVLDLKHKIEDFGFIKNSEFTKNSIANGYFELSSDSYILKFNVVKEYRVNKISPDKVRVYFIQNESGYKIEKISAFLSNEIRTMDEANEMVRKIIEYTNDSEIKQILNQVVEIEELMNSINVYSSVNKIESMVNKCKCKLNEILKRKPFVTMVEMERYLLDEQHDDHDIVIKINNIKFDKRFFDLYRTVDPYNGFFRGGGISMFDFIVLLLNNIDTY